VAWALVDGSVSFHAVLGGFEAAFLGVKQVFSPAGFLLGLLHELFLLGYFLFHGYYLGVVGDCATAEYGAASGQG
jgi:hypothetical protein